jgi:cytochrome c oxidase subunit 4
MKDKKEIRLYVKIYFALMTLLALTVTASRLNFSPKVSVALSLSFACLKAFLVLYFFMNLRSLSPKIRFFAFGAIVWVFILIGFISTDYLTRGLGGVLGK